MKIEEFFRKYANIPLSKRDIILDRIKYGETTMTNLYHRLHDLEEKMRPLRIEEADLLKIAEEFLSKLKNKL
jgi:DNA-binding NtrC family response regulator